MNETTTTAHTHTTSSPKFNHWGKGAAAVFTLVLFSLVANFYIYNRLQDVETSVALLKRGQMQIQAIQHNQSFAPGETHSRRPAQVDE